MDEISEIFRVHSHADSDFDSEKFFSVDSDSDSEYFILTVSDSDIDSENFAIVTSDTDTDSDGSVSPQGPTDHSLLSNSAWLLSYCGENISVA